MHQPTLIEYATKLGAEPALLHTLIAAAQKSDSTVIRYGSAALDAKGNIVGVGYNRTAQTAEEKAWADKDGILHSETAALFDAQQKGHAIDGLHVFVAPISPAADPATPAGHIMFRGGEHAPCFSCASCAPHLAEHKVTVNLLHNSMGWVPVGPDSVVEQGNYAVEREKATGRKVRGGDKIPGSSRREAALDEPGYSFDAAYLGNLETIKDNPAALQKRLYEKVAALETALSQAWSKDTSSYGDRWTPENPASGQCAVTAALVQEQLGGDIVRIMFTDHSVTDSHYFNVLPNGERVDFTYRQFSRDVTFQPPLETDTQALVDATHAYVKGKNFESGGSLVHDYLLSNQKTSARYSVLKERASEVLRSASEGHVR